MKRLQGYLVLSLFVIVSIAGILAILWYARSKAPGTGGGRSGAVIPVVVVEVSSREFVDAIEAIGTTRANEAVVITTKVTDIVKDVEFVDGMIVEPGALLVQLSDEQVRAELAEARANLSEQEKQLNRVSTLVRAQSLPQSQLDEQRALYEMAQARVAAREAALNDRRITAPFGGKLGLRMVSPGSLVTPGTEITTLDDIDFIKLDFSIPESFLSAVQVNQVVTARSAAYPDRLFRGHVQTISPRIDPVTRAVTVRAILENPGHLLLPGMLLTLDLERERKQAILIPEEAIIPIDNRKYVYTVNSDNSVNQVEVTTGHRRPGIVEILSGLEIGTLVVTEGGMRLRPGVEVYVQRTAELSADAGGTRYTLPSA